MHHLNYRKDIDGLRGVAVLSVIAYHAFPTWIHGGFVGVDVFFVISGYLISSIIYEEIRIDDFKFWQFYLRRVMRIFPALFVVLCLCLVTGWIILLPKEFNFLNKHIASAVAFISNLTLWSESGYFDVVSDVKPLLHLWSLGIEEQFYIFWPLLIYLIWKWRQENSVLIIIFLIGGISFAFNIANVRTDKVATFYSPVARAWELLLGALLAWFFVFKKNETEKLVCRWENFLSLAGAVILTLSLLSINAQSAFPGWNALLPTCGACLLILAGPGGWINRKLLSSQILVWFGLISYPLYLVHWPLLAYSGIDNGQFPSTSEREFLVVFSIFLAWVIYAGVEKPLKSLDGNMVASTLIICMSTLGILTFTIFTVVQTPITLLSLRFSDQLFRFEATDKDYSQGLYKQKIDDFELYLNKLDAPEVLFVGDSHIEQFQPRIVTLSRERNVKAVAILSRGGCPPIPHVGQVGNKCEAFHSTLRSYLNNSPQIKTIVLGGCWNCYFIDYVENVIEHPERYTYYYDVGEGRRYFSKGDGAEYAFSELGQFINELKKRYRVFIVLDNPRSKDLDPSLFAGVERRSAILTTKREPLVSRFTPLDMRQYDLNESILNLSITSGAVPVDQLPTLCPKNTCLRIDTANRPIYRDSDHLLPSFSAHKATYIDLTITE